MSKKILGLLAYVYRNGSYDCTNGGLSSKTESGVITGYGIGEDSEIFAPGEENPHYVIVRDICCGKERLRAIPADLVDSGKWTMFGGNFLYSCDSRFPSDSPIAIHDRVEG